MKTNISQLLQYLQLQPVEPDDDGNSTSPLDDFPHDDTINLDDDVDGNALQDSWTHIVDDIEHDPSIDAESASKITDE